MRLAQLTLLTALALPALVGCGAEREVAADRPSAPEPVPDGPVRTPGLATVVQTDGSGPGLCLGAVAESAPPQCDSLPLTGWDWDTTGSGAYETAGSGRWGSYAVTGTLSDDGLAVASAVPAALYDAAVGTPPAPSPPYGADGPAEVPDVLDVVYDDGSVQAWADERWGSGAVVVRSALVDAG